MLSLISYTIKYTVFFVCSYSAYIQLNRFKLTAWDLLSLLASIIVSVGLYYITLHVKLLVPPLMFLYCYSLFWIRFKLPKVYSLNVFVISVGLTCFAHILSSCLIYPFSGFINGIKSEWLKVLTSQLVLGFLNLFFTNFIFVFKRFKKGVKDLQHSKLLEWLVYLGAVAAFGYMLSYAYDLGSANFGTGILIFIMFFGLSLLLWWCKIFSTEKTYQIQKHNIEMLNRTLEANEEMNNKLKQQNEELARIIHRDNKLLPAMIIAVKQLIESPDPKNLQDVLESINDMFNERSRIIENFKKKDAIPSTGFTAVDAINDYISQRAIFKGAGFEIEIKEGAVTKLVSVFTNLTDLNTLLCDLGENAVIAVKDIKNGKIKIVYDVFEDAPRICFYDNGPHFDPKVIAQMGKTQITTHKAEGGSGIGLYTAFSILNKYSASLYIDETVNNGFTKCVIIAADGKNTTGVKTDRAEVVKISANNNVIYNSDMKDAV